LGADTQAEAGQQRVTIENLTAIGMWKIIDRAAGEA
jgi:hypothetical protein